MISRHWPLIVCILICGYFLFKNRQPKNQSPPSKPTVDHPVKQIPVPTISENKQTQSLPTLAPVTKQNIPVVHFKVIEGVAVAFGDVVLGKPSQEINGGITRFEEPRLWPTATIPYAIDSHVLQPDRITEALHHIEMHSSLRFRAIETPTEDSLVFQKSQNLCASYMGRIGGPQAIMIADFCQWQQVVHEVMHALGFPHEQSRLDRDRYVRVIEENILPEFLPQFEMVPAPLLEVLNSTGFDYHSIMLYSETAFQKAEGLRTLETLDQQHVIAPSKTGLSLIDKERLDLLFRNR